MIRDFKWGYLFSVNSIVYLYLQHITDFISNGLGD